MSTPRKQPLGGSVRLLTVRETATLLNIGVSTLRHNWQSWGMTAHHVGRGLRFRERDILHWLDQHKA